MTDWYDTKTGKNSGIPGAFGGGRGVFEKAGWRKQKVESSKWKPGFSEVDSFGALTAHFASKKCRPLMLRVDIMFWRLEDSFFPAPNHG